LTRSTSKPQRRYHNGFGETTLSDETLRAAQARLNPFEDRFISSVTVFELLHGVHRADLPARRSAREVHAERFIEAIPIIPFDESATRVPASS
jgi:predicted nucleic acid-binding protein